MPAAPLDLDQLLQEPQPRPGPACRKQRAAQAAHRQGKYLPVFRALMAEGALTEEAVDRILAANGVDLSAAKAAMAGPELGRHLTDINVNALALGLSATPTFFIDGRASASIHPEQLDRAIREAKAAR